MGESLKQTGSSLLLDRFVIHKPIDMLKFTRFSVLTFVSLVFNLFFLAPAQLSAQTVIVEIIDVLDPAVVSAEPDPTAPQPEAEGFLPTVDVLGEGGARLIQAEHPVLCTELIDLQGKHLLRDEQVYREARIDFSTLNRGVYVLRLYTAAGLIQRKVRR